MIMFILFLCVSLCAIAAQLSKRSQIWFMLISMIMLAVVMGGSYDCADYANYMRQYNYIELSNINFFPDDGGYSLINLIFKNWGFEYDEFRFVLDVLLLSLMFYVIYKILGEVYSLTTLFIIFPLAFDAVQVRNFILEVILLVGIYLYAKEKSKSMKKLMLSLMIAFSFHKTAVFFMLIYPLVKCAKFKLGRVLIFVLIMFGLCMPLYADYILANNMDVYYYLSSVENIDHYQYYALDEFEKRHITSWAVTIIYIFVIYWIRRKLKKNSVDSFTTRYADITYEFAKLMCLLLPFFPILQDLDRLVRDLTIPLYILVILYIKQVNMLSKSIVYYASLFMIACAVGYVKLYHGLGDMVWPLLENNHLFDLFK
ncbi:EpsG family protein [Selenomonas sp. ND2010]|uniref:EpsG family protein n=1 Tax=Selenomonas sp. ND2010 TaxID=1410618 RepID=UPI00051C0F78|nr:EpsG family protein [Selenomonas sp. ND2010]